MNILVTGASGGIGKAICSLFLSAGHKVCGMDIAGSDISDENYTHIIHDICDTSYPEIDGPEAIINCAGVSSGSAYDIAVNLTAVIELTEHYAFHDGIRSVLHISSASALTGSEFPHYAASKGGLTAYTKNLAMRLAKYGATVNSLCPGAVITSFNDHILEDEKLCIAVADESLLKKWIEPEEIAQWAYFMVCINKSMTGESLMIDNGESINMNFIW